MNVIESEHIKNSCTLKWKMLIKTEFFVMLSFIILVSYWVGAVGEVFIWGGVINFYQFKGREMMWSTWRKERLFEALRYVELSFLVKDKLTADTEMKWEPALHDYLIAGISRFLWRIKNCFPWKKQENALNIDICRSYRIRYIAWGVIFCLTLSCSITNLVIIDVLIIWGNVLQFVTIRSFFFTLSLAF